MSFYSQFVIKGIYSAAVERIFSDRHLIVQIMARGTQECFRCSVLCHQPLPVFKSYCVSVLTVWGHGWVCFLMPMLQNCHLQIDISPLALSGSSVLHSPSAHPSMAKKKSSLQIKHAFQNLKGGKIVFNVQINMSYKLYILCIEKIQNNQVQ